MDQPETHQPETHQPETVPLTTSIQGCCPHCFSLAIRPLGRMVVGGGTIRGDYRCHGCLKDFVLVR